MNIYEWRKMRAESDRADRSLVGHALDVTDVPIERCTAKGGPAHCRNHAPLLDRMDELDGGNDARRIGREIYDRAEKEGFTDSVMKSMFALDKAIREGKIKPVRVPHDFFVGMTEEDFPTWFTALYHVLAARAKGMNGQTLRGDREESRREEDFARRYAQKVGVWNDDLVGKCETEHGERFAEGGESYCYFDKDESGNRKSVLKVNNTVFNREPVRAIERLMLFNRYFPEAALKAEGMGIMKRTGRHAGDFFSFLLRQRAFDFTDEDVTADERDGLMLKKGFVPFNGSAKTFVSTDDGHTVTIGDLNVNNIRHTVGGEIVVPDALPNFNIPQLNRSGTYNYDTPSIQTFKSKRENGTEDAMPKEENKRKAWSPYNDEGLNARLDEESKNVTWKSLHDHAMIREDSDAVKPEDMEE